MEANPKPEPLCRHVPDPEVDGDRGNVRTSWQPRPRAGCHCGQEVHRPPRMHLQWFQPENKATKGVLHEGGGVGDRGPSLLTPAWRQHLPDLTRSKFQHFLTFVPVLLPPQSPPHHRHCFLGNRMGVVTLFCPPKSSQAACSDGTRA